MTETIMVVSLLDGGVAYCVSYKGEGRFTAFSLPCFVISYFVFAAVDM